MIYELAMLFCHAGSSVFFAFQEGAENWVSATAIEEITKNEARTSTCKPGWCNSRHPYDLTILVSPDENMLQALLGNGSANELVDFIKNKSKHIDVLLESNRGSPLGNYLPENKISLDFFPVEGTNFTDYYQKLFSQQIWYLSGLQKLDQAKFYLQKKESSTDIFAGKDAEELIEQVKRAGFQFSNDEQAEICIRIDPEDSAEHGSLATNEKGISSIKLNYFSENSAKNHLKKTSVEGRQINAYWRKNGLEVHDHLGIRVFPSVEGLSCFKRFATYLCDTLLEMKSEMNNPNDLC